MKQIIASILLLAFLSFQLSELIIYISFKINQDYIAEFLCVEKDIEDSTCHGCCQLEKKLNDQEEQKSDIPAPVNNKVDINIFSKQVDIQGFISELSLVFKCFYQNNYSFLITNSVFHPPQIV